MPYAPGGSTDPISRKYSEILEKELKVKVIVENKPGASATIGTGAVIRAAPDGYTIGLGSSSSLAYQPLEMKGLAWKSPRLPVDRQTVRPAVDHRRAGGTRCKTFDEFIAEAKANPRKLKVSVSGLRTTTTSPSAAQQALGHAHRHRAVHRRRRRSDAGGLGGRVDGIVGFAPA